MANLTGVGFNHPVLETYPADCMDVAEPTPSSLFTIQTLGVFTIGLNWLCSLEGARPNHQYGQKTQY